MMLALAFGLGVVVGVVAAIAFIFIVLNQLAR